MKRNNRSKNRYLPQDRIAMRLADRYGMTEGYKEARRKGYTPLEAREDWDLLDAEARKEMGEMSNNVL